MTGRVHDMILDPKQTGMLGEVIAEGGYYGMQTFDQHLLEHLQAGRITMEDAVRTASSPHDFKLHGRRAVAASARARIPTRARARSTARRRRPMRAEPAVRRSQPPASPSPPRRRPPVAPPAAPPPVRLRRPRWRRPHPRAAPPAASAPPPGIPS